MDSRGPSTTLLHYPTTIEPSVRSLRQCAWARRAWPRAVREPSPWTERDTVVRWIPKWWATSVICVVRSASAAMTRRRAAGVIFRGRPPCRHEAGTGPLVSQLRLKLRYSREDPKHQAPIGRGGVNLGSVPGEDFQADVPVPQVLDERHQVSQDGARADRASRPPRCPQVAGL
jgi:hypothetical protein